MKSIPIGFFLVPVDCVPLEFPQHAGSNYGTVTLLGDFGKELTGSALRGRIDQWRAIGQTGWTNVIEIHKFAK